MGIPMKDWVKMNERTRPVSRELTDEFLEMCEREPENIMMRLARVSGLPEGVNHLDERIRKLFDVEPLEEGHAYAVTVENGPMWRRSRMRPQNYKDLRPEEQWQIDKDLGILDWDGDPSK